MRSSTLIKQVKLLDIDLNIHYAKTNPVEERLRQECEESFHRFVEVFWHVVEGDNEFKRGTHIDALCAHLEACFDGTIKKLIINIPPRHSKSSLCSVFFPAWAWTKSPGLSFLNISGQIDLAIRDNVNCRRIIMSEEYRKLWGREFFIYKDMNSKQRFRNNRGGEKIVKSITSSSMGEGGDFRIIDDPNPSQDIKSDVTREGTNETFSSAISTRRKNIQRDCLILTQQRIHENDLTGHIMEMGYDNVVHLFMPFEYEVARKCITVPLKGMTEPWQDPRTVEGQILWPEIYTTKQLIEEVKRPLSPYHRAAQLQQRPAPQEGGLFKREWFCYWDKPLPKFRLTLQSWDTALSLSEDACESAMTTWGVFTNDEGQRCVMLLNAWSGKLEQPELRQMIFRCSRNYYNKSHEGMERQGPKPTYLVIEKAANGIAMIQDLQRMGVEAIGFDPKNHGLKNEFNQSATSKFSRAALMSPFFEQRQIYFPVHGETKQPIPSAQTLIDQALIFPRGRQKDIIDSMSQAFIFMRQFCDLHIRGEEPELDYPRFKDYTPYDHATQLYENRIKAPGHNMK